MAKNLTDAEFIEKIKSLHFGGSKKTVDTPCSKCGHPLKQHVKAVMIPIRIEVRRRPQSEEKSFAA